MRTTLHVVLTALLALVLHLALGWTWTIVAGIVGGAWAVQRGWVVGALGVGLDWAVLVLYNYATARAATQGMADTVGELLGNMPAPVVVAATVLTGTLIGGVGGALGTALRGLIRARP